MQIRAAAETDLAEIMKLYQLARKFMAENGNPTQWGSTYPSQGLILEDIRKRQFYVCITEDGIMAAAFFFAPGPDPSYKKLESGEWLNDKPYFVVHRITSPRGIRGAASFCLDWSFAKSGQNLRIDTHKNNIPMQKLLAKNGFVLCGTIVLPDQTGRMIYQKTGILENIIQENKG